MSTVSRERLGALITFLLCAAAWSQLGAMPAEAAFFPRLILGLAMLLAAAWGVTTFFGSQSRPEKNGDEQPAPFIENPRNLAVFILCLVGYIALIDTIGYFTSTALFIVASGLALGFRRPAIIAATTVGFIAFIYVLFVVIFDRPLPIEFFQAG